MSQHHPDQFFFLCLAGSLAAFLAPSIIDELTTTVDELFGRRRKPPVVESVTPLPPKEEASRVREHFQIIGGACPPLNKLRNRLRRTGRFNGSNSIHIRACRVEPSLRSLAAMNKSLAQMNKSGDGIGATKRQHPH